MNPRPTPSKTTRPCRTTLWVFALVCIVGISLGYVWRAHTKDPPLQPLPESTYELIPDIRTHGATLTRVYARLGPQVHQQMRTKGQYRFHLSDLPPSEAAAIVQVLTEYSSVHKILVKSLGPNPDLTALDYAFERLPGDPEQKMPDTVSLRVFSTDGKGIVIIGFAYWPG